MVDHIRGLLWLISLCGVRFIYRDQTEKTNIFSPHKRNFPPGDLFHLLKWEHQTVYVLRSFSERTHAVAHQQSAPLASECRDYLLRLASQERTADAQGRSTLPRRDCRSTSLGRSVLRNDLPVRDQALCQQVGMPPSGSGDHATVGLPTPFHPARNAMAPVYGTTRTSSEGAAALRQADCRVCGLYAAGERAVATYHHLPQRHGSKFSDRTRTSPSFVEGCVGTGRSTGG